MGQGDDPDFYPVQWCAPDEKGSRRLARLPAGVRCETVGLIPDDRWWSTAADSHDAEHQNEELRPAGDHILSNLNLMEPSHEAVDPAGYPQPHCCYGVAM